MAYRFAVVSNIVALNVLLSATSCAQPITQLTPQEIQYSATHSNPHQYSDHPSPMSNDQRPSLAGIKYIPLEETVNYTLYDKLEPARETRELWIREVDGTIAVFEDDTGDEW